jgi:hypothetical protein
MLTYPSRLHSTQNHQGSQRFGDSGLRRGPSSHELFQGCDCTKPGVNANLPRSASKYGLDRPSNGLEQLEVVESLPKTKVDALRSCSCSF